jgi:uncharacterized membrane-anchored protein
MSLGLGYLTSTIIFAGIFACLVIMQIKASKYNQWIYWITIIATTTVGTTLADFCDRSLGIGYTGGTLILVTLLLVSFLSWYLVTGSISIKTISSNSSECFYWLTIMFSQTLGTAFGDWLSDTASFGYIGAGIVFSLVLLILVFLNYFTKISKTFLFWAAFVLTRPLGAVVGDFLDKPISHGGLDLSRYGASATLIGAIVILLFMFKTQASRVKH